MFSLSFFIHQKLPISDPVAKMMLEAATNGDLSVMQLLVKQFVNVEGKVGMMTASDHYRLQWVGVANLWSGREYEKVVGYMNSENSHWNKGRVFKTRLA